ncbi:MAG: hypothetical protein AAGF26_01770, partial [Cyanobacteria bacterium P01_G01_bin.49]
MIREKLVQKYRNLVSHSYPYIGSLLSDCYIMIIDGCLNRVSPPYYYLGVYYSGRGPTYKASQLAKGHGGVALLVREGVNIEMIPTSTT